MSERCEVAAVSEVGGAEACRGRLACGAQLITSTAPKLAILRYYCCTWRLAVQDGWDGDRRGSAWGPGRVVPHERGARRAHSTETLGLERPWDRAVLRTKVP